MDFDKHERYANAAGRTYARLLAEHVEHGSAVLLADNTGRFAVERQKPAPEHHKGRPPMTYFDWIAAITGAREKHARGVRGN